jgi:hypothetical protein
VKVLVFIDHDIISRHFVMSGVLRALTARADVVFVFPDADGRRMTLDPALLALDAPWTRLPVDSRRVQMWRWQLFSQQLKFRFGRAEHEIRRMRRRMLGWKASLLLTIAGLPGVEPLFLRWLGSQLARRPNKPLSDLFDRERPDAVVHPSVLEGLFINDLVQECAARRIPLVVAMNSWDNPSTKRAIVGHPDRLLVWGPQTAAHAKRFMSIPVANILEFGAAQFDVFREPPRISRAQFAAEHACGDAATIILFAGSSALTDEFGALKTIEAAIESGRIPNSKVIYRPHPWGNGGRDGHRFANAVWKHVSIHSPTRDYVARLGRERIGMTLPDYRDTHDLLSVVDIVVSPLSTILVEAMLHGKAAVVFTARDAGSSAILANRLPMIHFDDFLAVDAVGRADTDEQLLDLLEELARPGMARRAGDECRLAAAHFVTSFDSPWGERLVSLLDDLTPGRADVETGLEARACS